MLERVKLYMHIHIFKKQNDISNQQTLGMEERDFQSYNIYQSQMSNSEKQTKKKITVHTKKQNSRGLFKRKNKSTICPSKISDKDCFNIFKELKENVVRAKKKKCMSKMGISIIRWKTCEKKNSRAEKCKTEEKIVPEEVYLSRQRKGGPKQNREQWKSENTGTKF